MTTAAATLLPLSHLTPLLCSSFLLPYSCLPPLPSPTFTMLVRTLCWPIQSVVAAAALAITPLSVAVPWLMRKGRFRNDNPRECQESPAAVATLPAWVRRARNAHYNNVESLGFYASGVAVAIIAGVNPVLIGRLATQYIWSRALYNVVYIVGEERIKTRGYLRSAVFFAGCVPPPVRLWLEAAAAATV